MSQGSLEARTGEQALHSRYNPIGEAEKYINSLALRQDTRFFILIEPGRGYMIPLLHQKFPHAQILVLHVEDVPGEAQSEETYALTWRSGSGTSLQQFLEQEIPDTDAASIGIIEWRPSLAVYGEKYRWLLSETVDFIKRIDANKRTIRVFGTRWFKNFFKNISVIRRLALVPTALPWIIAGAGPSLEQSIPLIKDLKRKTPLLLLASSSSVPALLVRDLIPDLIIATDGGGWARFHLYDCLRGLPKKPPFGLAASLCAALPSQGAVLPLLPLSEGNLWQNLILQGLNIPFISLIQRGTVTASALDLAFTLTKGNVFITGVDLSHQDIRTHARPYSLERSLEEAASRLNPVYSQTFARSFGITEGGSHTIYAAWFSKHLGDYPQRLYSLGDNHPVFKDLKSWEAADWGITTTKKVGTEDQIFGSRELCAQGNLAKQGVDILLQSLADPQTAERIKQELGELLFPDDADITIGTLRDAILTLTGPYCRGTLYG